MSFAKQVTSSQKHLLYFVTAKDARFLDAYYYVMVDRGKEKKFEKDFAGGYINLEDYGKILASDYGREPSARVKQRLKDEYGFDVD